MWFSRIRGLFTKRYRTTQEHEALAQHLWAIMKDRYVRQEFTSCLTDYLRYPCDGTFDKIVEFWVRWRTETIASACPGILIDVMEAAAKRPLSPDERAILFEVRVMRGRLAGPPELITSSVRLRVEEMAKSALVNAITNLPVGVPVPDELSELEAIRLALHLVTRGDSYPYIYLIAAGAVAKRAEQFYESHGQQAAFERLTGQILAREMSKRN